MIRHLSIDIETYSSNDLKKCGLYKYVEAPDFEILLFAYSFDGQDVQIVDLANGEPMPDELLSALCDPEVIKHAYNAAFEWHCISRFCKTPVNQWQCTMLHGMYAGYTAGLAVTGQALNFAQDKQKMSEGSALIRYFCVPCKPTKRNGGRTRNLPRHEPERWELFKEYCKQDVRTEMEIERTLAGFPVPAAEQILWQLDQLINTRGVQVDTGLIQGALHCDRSIRESLKEEAMELTGLENPNSREQLRLWLENETEQEVKDLRKDTVADWLKKLDPGKVQRVLQIRQELSKTSVKKYAVMDNAMCSDGRIRGLLQFYGANRTGRWAGKLVQIHNLPRNYIQTLGLARGLTKQCNVNMLKLVYGNVSDTLSQLIRTAFIAKEGHTLLVTDFSAIEARVLAWLAGEQWRIDVFSSHGKIYEASAAQMFGVDIELIKKGNPEYALRQKGKVAELALGYQGSTGALVQMGAIEMGICEEELEPLVKAWRQSNRQIVNLWYAFEKAALDTVKNCRANAVRGIVFNREGDCSNNLDFLTIKLPFGRKLYYVQPYIRINRFEKDAVHYKGTDQKTKKWGEQSTYGGKLTENIVQAIARDCLARSMIKLEGAGYQIVMHVHDEVVIEAPEKDADLDLVNSIMSEPIPWAKGLTLNAEGFISPYYKKD